MPIELLARQLALKEAGPMADEYFAKYRLRLIAEVEEIITTSPHFTHWRFPSWETEIQNAALSWGRRFLCSKSSELRHRFLKPLWVISGHFIKSPSLRR
jgi:hypothetical protein